MTNQAASNHDALYYFAKLVATYLTPDNIPSISVTHTDVLLNFEIECNAFTLRYCKIPATYHLHEHRRYSGSESRQIASRIRIPSLLRELLENPEPQFLFESEPTFSTPENESLFEAMAILANLPPRTSLLASVRAVVNKNPAISRDILAVALGAPAEEKQKLTQYVRLIRNEITEEEERKAKKPQGNRKAQRK